MKDPCEQRELVGTGLNSQTETSFPGLCFVDSHQTKQFLIEPTLLCLPTVVELPELQNLFSFLSYRPD